MEGHLHAKSFGGTCNWPNTRGACLIEVAAIAGGTVLNKACFYGKIIKE